MNEDYRFLNPYNFVRVLSMEQTTTEDLDQILLGRCSPPPLDRYVGLTGKIKCKIKTVTPLFISDSEHVEANEEVENHYSYRFFKLSDQNNKEKFAIPSSSLRGMLRSIFEAATNSCLSVFENKRLNYRLETRSAIKMKPARVISLPSSDSPGTVQLCKYAKVEMTLLKNEKWKCGDKAYANVEEKSRNQYLVRDISKEKIPKFRKGWLKITGKGIANKKNERFFFPINNNSIAEFSKEVMNDYNEVLSQQKKEVNFLTEYQNEKLSVGDLVYVQKDQNNRIIAIALVPVAKLKYKKSTGDLLEKSHHHCSKYKQLCPACRVFGWVSENIEEKRLGRKVAYAGRIKISNAILSSKPETFPPLQIDFLASPKPTTTSFYLFEKSNPNSYVSSYDQENVGLRGRKFYRHHGRIIEETFEVINETTNLDPNKRTLRDVLKPEAKFEFEISFENLAPVELGALLWAIELEDGMYHKLGLAKPLGFGSISIKIEELFLLNFNKYYTAYNTAEAWQKIDREKWQAKIALFKEKLAEKYSCSDFEDLLNIKDLKNILSEASIPIHYPRLTKDSKGKNYEWFTKNKEKNKLSLQFPPDDAGLPINLGSKSKKKKK